MLFWKYYSTPMLFCLLDHQKKFSLETSEVNTVAFFTYGENFQELERRVSV